MSLNTRGIVLMLLSTVFFTLMALSVKLLARIPVLEIIFFRALISTVLCLVGIRRARISPLGNKHGLLILRGVAGALALSLNFWLLQNIPLAAASVLLHLSPIATTIIGIWFVQEKVSSRTMLWFLLSFAGIVIMQGFDYRIEPLHLAVGIVASFAMGIAYNCVRKLGRTEHPLVIILYFPLVCLPLSGLWSLFYGVMPAGIEWLWIALVGIFTQFGQYFMTLSYQVAEINRVAIINYTGVVFSILLGIAVFDEHFNLLTYAGMALMIAGVILNVLTRNNVSNTAATGQNTKETRP